MGPTETYLQRPLKPIEIDFHYQDGTQFHISPFTLPLFYFRAPSKRSGNTIFKIFDVTDNEIESRSTDCIACALTATLWGGGGGSKGGLVDSEVNGKLVFDGKYFLGRTARISPDIFVKFSIFNFFEM